MKIEKKAWPEYFQKIKNGTKTYDLRIADFECKSGDILVLKEYDPKTQQYTGRIIEKEITYIGKLKNMEKLYDPKDIEKYGFQILSLK